VGSIILSLLLRADGRTSLDDALQTEGVAGRRD
jgi:hypothetical protein